MVHSENLILHAEDIADHNDELRDRIEVPHPIDGEWSIVRSARWQDHDTVRIETDAFAWQLDGDIPVTYRYIDDPGKD